MITITEAELRIKALESKVNLLLFREKNQVSHTSLNSEIAQVQRTLSEITENITDLQTRIQAIEAELEL